ncbi:MAG TPA: hypothetical protein VJ783_08150 [Pirellulales bacterium]|nr:hypothetical protein [Pirellulales bacterium]
MPQTPDRRLNRPFTLARAGVGGLMALGVLLGAARSSSADPAPVGISLTGSSEAAGLAREWVDHTTARLTADAQREFLRRRDEQLQDGAGQGVVPELEAIEPESRRALIRLLAQNNQPVLAALERSADEAAGRRQKLVAELLKVRTQLYDNQLELYEAQRGQRIAGQMASLLSVDNRWFWLFGLVAVASLAVVNLHERRHELRRWLNGGRARALGLSKYLTGLMALLALITFVSFLFGDRLYHLLLRGMNDERSPHEEMIADNQELTKQAAQARRDQATAEDEHRQALDHWRKLHADDEALGRLFEQAQTEETTLGKLHRELAVESGVARQLEADSKRLQEVQKDRVRNTELRESYGRQQRWIRGGLGLGLLGLATSGGVLFRRGMRRRQRKTRDTCPLCLGNGTFEPLAPEATTAHPGLEMVRCKNVISEQPYEECEFTFSAMYCENVKLCFPTLGIPQAGKTHWLAMVYRELNRGNFPGVVQFERIRSTSSEEFDLVVDEILNKKMGPMATQVGRIPHPLIFNFLDHDSFGPSNVLVNIFDYSGEVTRSQTIEDRQRQRALDGDGFLFFLDPTEPSETQSQALAGFREDLRRIKGIRAGKQVHVPIALCVSKLDLMVNQPYADPHGGGVVEKFYRDLGEIGWATDVRSIVARSQLMAWLRDTVWPGWQIERQIDDLFGGRFLFFPLTPVGLDGLGERDLSRRTIAPVGLLDPLLWLLHMNGYPVLA